MDLRIVPISAERIAEYRAVLDSVARERRYLAFLEAPPLEDCTAFVLDNLREGHPHVVALLEGRVVGWCDISPIPRPVNAHCGVLGIGIAKQFRGRGIGRELMRAALAQARGKGLTRIELMVRESNRNAIVLYQRMGFEVEGLKRNAVRADGKYENYVCMALLFESS